MRGTGVAMFEGASIRVSLRKQWIERLGHRVEAKSTPIHPRRFSPFARGEGIMQRNRLRR